MVHCRRRYLFDSPSLLSTLLFSFALFHSWCIPCLPSSLSFNCGLCVLGLPTSVFGWLPPLKGGMGGWQGVCFRAEQLWGCKSCSHLLSTRWCLRRSCLDRTARGPDPPATCTCFAEVPWYKWTAGAKREKDPGGAALWKQQSVSWLCHCSCPQISLLAVFASGAGQELINLCSSLRSPSTSQTNLPTEFSYKSSIS